MMTNRSAPHDRSATAVSDPGVLAVFSILMGLRKRTGLSPERLRSTEIDVSGLLVLPVVRRYAHLCAMSTLEALPGVVAHVARQLPETQRLIVDSELCLRLLDAAPPGDIDPDQLYAPDLGLRRRYLSAHWYRLHEALHAADIPPAPKERALRDAPERDAFAALAAALAAGAVPDVIERATVTVIGDAVMDQNHMVEQIPTAGMNVYGDYGRHPGGKGLNRAVALARLGLDARLLTVVGDDQDGSEILHYLTARGVDTSLVEVKRGKTPVTTVIRTLGGQHAIIAFKLRERSLQVSDVEQAAIRQAITTSQAVLLTFETPEEVVERVLRVLDSLPPSDRPLLIVDAAPALRLPTAARRFLAAVAYVVGGPDDLAKLWPVGESYLASVDELLARVSGGVCVIEGRKYTVFRPGIAPIEIVLPSAYSAEHSYSSAAYSAALIYRLLTHRATAEVEDFRWAAAAVVAADSIAAESASAGALPDVPDSMPAIDRTAAELERIIITSPSVDR